MSDNNQFEDDQVNFDSPDDGGFEDFEGGGNSLGDMWRNNPMVKIGVIAGVLITIIGAVVLFGGGDEKVSPSRTKIGKDLEDNTADGEVSEVMRRAIEERNEQREEEAIRSGDSAMPTPINTPVNRLALPEDEAAIEDPLERWRRIQEERQRMMQTDTPEIETVDPSLEAIDNLANAMLGQMEEIMRVKSEPYAPQHVSITENGWLEQERKRAREAEEEEKARKEKEIAEKDGTGAEIVNILIPAGTIEYGQLLTEANSDAQAPILAQLVSGPLAGSRLIGTFKTEDNFLVLTFNQIVIDGVSYSTEALAVNPETTTPGMATDIDRRYFTRVILPAAAKFVEGMGKAIAEQGANDVVVTGDVAVSSEPELDTEEQIFSGVEEAASRIGEILDENADNTSALIRVEAGTPMGLVFLKPVTDETTQ